MYIKSIKNYKNQLTKQEIIKKIKESYPTMEQFLEQYIKGNVNKNALELIESIIDNIIDIDYDAKKENYNLLMHSIIGKKASKTDIHLYSSKKLQEAIENILTIREVRAIKERYGLESGQPKELMQVEMEKEITPERKRQIIETALKKLKTENRKNPYSYDLGKIKNIITINEREIKQIETIENRILRIGALYKDKQPTKEEKEQLKEWYTQIEELQEKIDGKGKNKETLNKKDGIEKLKLAPRIYGTLRRNGIKTIKKLTEYTKEDLRRIEGIGEGAINKITETLMKSGIELRKTQEIEEELKQRIRLETRGRKKIKIPQEIDELEITHRVKKALTEAGITTLEQLTKYTEQELLEIRNIGTKGQQEIIKKVQEKGLKFKENRYKIEQYETITAHTRNTLLRHGITTIEQLEKVNYKEIYGLGPLSFKEIEEILEESKKRKKPTELEAKKEEKETIQDRLEEIRRKIEEATKLLEECEKPEKQN